MKNIVLIGFMGTGKTAIGKRLARKTNRQFIDTDAEIEKVTGKTITRLFAKDGEIRFRSEENILIKKLANKKGLVISTGGGLVINPENVELLRPYSVFIALNAQPEVIFQRIKGKRNRPLLAKGGDLLENIKKMLAERRETYSIAEYAIDTGQASIDDTVEQVYNYLVTKGYHNHIGMKE